MFSQHRPAADGDSGQKVQQIVLIGQYACRGDRGHPDVHIPGHVDPNRVAGMNRIHLSSRVTMLARLDAWPKIARARPRR